MANSTASGAAPLDDEICWQSIPHLMQMGGYLHANNVLYYFAESPFFDTSSNNANLVAQATHNEDMQRFTSTREAFEDRLKMMQGLEFVVSRDPLAEFEAAREAAAGNKLPVPSEVSNVWVVRKQYRRKRPGRPDDVELLATYFIVDGMVFMAPSVYRVVGSRMLSTVTSLTKAFSATSSLPLFSASHGHTYIPTVSKTLETARLARSDPAKQSTDAMTPAQSAAMIQNAHNISKGIQLMNNYGKEYIDEIPLVGEPGSFLFSTSSSTTRKPENQSQTQRDARHRQTRTTLPNRFGAATTTTTTSSVPASVADKV